MKKICIVTGTRSEYGLLSPLIRKMINDPFFQVHLTVTGSHLSEAFGNTYRCIEADGFVINKKISILTEDNSSCGIAEAMGNALNKFSQYFSEISPDMILILGDRYEIFAVATVAAIMNIPIAHLHGGEVTLGAYDEFFRHGITKMSTLHFTSCAEHRKRVIQLGENPKYVFDVGAIGIENIMNMPLMSKQELEKSIDFELGDNYALVTFHPVTLEKSSLEEQCDTLMEALGKIQGMKFIITKANADDGGRLINSKLDEYAVMYPDKVSLHTNLGQLRYLSAMKYSNCVIGNSSSGLIEAPSFHIPTINIGNRQKGRVRGTTVIDCAPNVVDILNAISKAQTNEFRESITNVRNPYGEGNVSTRIINEIKKFLQEQQYIIGLKEFYDVNFEV